MAGSSAFRAWAMPLHDHSCWTCYTFRLWNLSLCVLEISRSSACILLEMFGSCQPYSECRTLSPKTHHIFLNRRAMSCCTQLTSNNTKHCNYSRIFYRYTYLLYYIVYNIYIYSRIWRIMRILIIFDAYIYIHTCIHAYIHTYNPITWMICFLGSIWHNVVLVKAGVKWGFG